MTKIELLQELAHCIDSSIEVKYSDDNCFYAGIDYPIIYIPKYKEENGLQGAFQSYYLIENGMDYTRYSSKYVFSFLHEIGHLINGFGLDYQLQVKAVENAHIPPFKAYEEYIRLDDEWYAWAWAYEFLINNKKVIKILELEMKDNE